MNRWAILTFCFASAVCCAWGQANEKGEAQEDHASVLSAYRKACLTPENASTVMTFDSLAVLYLEQNPESALGQGMKSTAQLMLAESMWNPIDKLSQFQAWQPRLEEAIAAQPFDPDLRFFRLSVQYSVPALLQYNQDMEKDAEVVKQAHAEGHWSNQPEHESFVIDFLNQL